MVVDIERLDDFGRGIAYIDGRIVFVYDALPLERVKINIIRDRNKYMEARVEEYLLKSPFRVNDICPYSFLCGGCNIRHMSFDLENKFKRDKVINIMRKFANIDSNIISDVKSSNDAFYRNKVVLHGENGVLGLYKDRSHDIVEVKECLLLNKRINDAIGILNSVNKNITAATIKVSNDSTSVLIDITGEVYDTKPLLDFCDVLILNGKYLTSNKKLLTNIGNKKYYQGVMSFFQVNCTLTKELYDKVYELLSKSFSRRVLDLYCGCGTIGIYVSDLCSEIVGIDYNSSNIMDAEANAKLNGVSNISFICDKVENRIDSFDDIDTIIVDPPRSGLDSKTKGHLGKIGASTIIYVSCDPVTLARDIHDLSDIYECKEINLFNMFPRTHHVESVCLLSQKIS